jgi:hypothetical protein
MLGDVPFEVRAGAQAAFLQSAVLLDAEGKTCEFIGDIDKRFIVAPDLDVLLR